MPAELAALAAVLLAITGVVGIIVPVLPGSLFVGVGALVWAIFGNAPWPWVWFVVAAVLLVIGAVSSSVLTGGELKNRGIPTWPVVVSLIVGVIAGFYLPAVGLVVGFALTLVVCEFIRVKNLSEALRTSLAALKAIGVGMLVELGCAMAASSVLGASILTGLFL